MKKKLLLISPLLILLIITAIGLVALYKHSKTDSIEARLAAGETVMMPEFSLPELFNQTGDPRDDFSSNELKGKLVLINVFASWCVSCLAEHQLLIDISRENKQENKIAVYGIAWRDINQNTKDYLSKNGNPYLRVGVDNKGIFSKLLNVSGTPESFLVSPNGKILRYWKGAIDAKEIGSY